MLLLLALACNGKDGKDGNTSGNTDAETADSGDTSAEVEPPDLKVDTSPSGEIACFVGDVIPAPTPNGEGTAEVHIELYDPLTGDLTPSATTRIYYGDSDEGEPAVAREAGEDGVVGLIEIDACTLLSVSTTVNRKAEDSGAEDDRVDTQLVGLVAPSTTSWQIPAFETQSVKSLPGQLGQQPQQGKGMVFGRVTDCADKPLDNVEITYDKPVGAIAYFEDGSPSSQRQWTSADGQFVLLNVDAAPGRLTAWIWDGEKHAAFASASIQIKEDAVRVVSMRAAREGETSTPEDCVSE